MKTRERKLELFGLILLAIGILLGTNSLFAAGATDQCLSCHKDVGSEPGKKYETDVHFQKGISCAACHGGDPNQQEMEKAMDPKKGFRGVPKGEAIVKTCLSCHADASVMGKYHSKIDTQQFERFRDSVHGKVEIATCITCHGVHEIRSPRDPESPVFPTREVELCNRCHGDAAYMKTFNPSMPTDQLEKYRTSVHGQRLEKGDVKVATCSDCHGGHDIFAHTDPRSHVYALNVPATCSKCHSDAAYMKGYGIPTDQFAKYKDSVHGNALLGKQDVSAPACNDCHGNHGAAPPGLQSVSHVCGECHALNAEYFEKSPHAAAFKDNGIAQCEACHGNHGVKTPDDEMIHVGKNSVCESCHSEGEPALKTA
ncbi:MAG TPA: cytochrome c3 family protein, partial [Acidobacteriota bacterium]|nr:cytochrome c3 family protein [Acidobacteriota bacterium]